MATTYVPNADQITEPLASRSVESAAQEFRTLKTKVSELANAYLSVGSGGMPGTAYIYRVSGDGTTTVFTLPATPPAEASVSVYVQGIYQHHDTFSLAGAALTFSEAPVAGTNNVEISLIVPQGVVAVYGIAVTTDGVQSLTNKTLSLGSNTISGTIAQFNIALTDGDFATLAGVEALTNKTLTNPTITNYTETLFTANTSAAITVSLANGTIQKLTLTANSTITMPTAAAGKSFVIMLVQDATGSRSVTWSTVKWPAGTAPTITSTASKQDVFSFFSDGANWYGSTLGQNYTP